MTPPAVNVPPPHSSDNSFPLSALFLLPPFPCPSVSLPHHRRSTNLLQHITMASGYYFTPQDPRRATMGQPMAQTAGFFRGGAAAVTSGGAWPVAPHGVVPANPAWTAHASAAFAGLAAGGSHRVGEPSPPPQSLPPSGPPSTPPTAPSAAPTGRVRNRRGTRASTARPRSASPVPSGAGGLARPGPAAQSDAEEEDELTVANVRGREAQLRDGARRHHGAARYDK